MRQRWIAAVVAVIGLAVSGCSGDARASSATVTASPAVATALSATAPPSPAIGGTPAGYDVAQAATPTPAPSPVEPQPTATATRTEHDPGPPSDERRLEPEDVITGDISPKSVVASGTGLFVAQNMMYRHTITAYNRDGDLLKTISDEVVLSELGVDGYSGEYRGAPVEAAFSPNGAYAYVSNYSMYGPGFGPEGSDSCSPASGYDDSFVYRIDAATLEIDRAIKVGAVPKYVAVTPDNRFVLVSNWCSYSLSVIDVQRAREIERIDLAAYPRGIAVSPDSSVAYIAVMGTTNIATVDLKNFAVAWVTGVGSGPRHVVIDPDGSHLYVTLNRDGTVAKIDTGTGEVVARVATGAAPRSMAISDDGESLYVVNYHSDSVSKVRTEDMEVLQTLPTNDKPIGITYDAQSRQVWVACYSGSIMIFEDADAG